MNNQKQKTTVLDFFGNEIEVGDEVAYVESSGELESALVTEVDPTNALFMVQLDGYAFFMPKGIIVNTEKKHREKALDYLVAEAQEMGLYEDGVGVNTTKDGYE